MHATLVEVSARRAASVRGRWRTVASLALPPELARLAGRAASAMARPDDAEAVHQLRVAARRVRAVTEQVGEGLGPSAPEVVDALASAQRRLGSVRDADVVAERLESLAGLLPPWWAGRATTPAPGALSGVVQASAEVSPDERRALVVGAAEVAADAGLRLQALLDQGGAPSAAEIHEARRAARGCLARLAGRLERRVAEVVAAERVPSEPGRPPAHRARIAAKRYRYVLEAFSAVGLVVARPGLVEALGDLQDALGLGLDARRSQQALADGVPAGMADEALMAVAWSVSANDVRHGDRAALLAWKLVVTIGSAATWS